MNPLEESLFLYPTYHWDFGRLSTNSHLNLQIIQHHPDRRWNWYRISQNEYIMWQITVLNHGIPPWKWHEMMSCRMIESWRIYSSLSNNINIYVEDMVDQLWLGWDFHQINSKVNIKHEMDELGLHDIDNCQLH